MQTNKDLVDQIWSRLKQIEDERGIRFVLAAWRGSRASGLASANSDYDLGTVFCYPPPLYMHLTQEPITIACKYPTAPIVDIIGWEIRHYCDMVRRSNPQAIMHLFLPRVWGTRAMETLADMVREGRWSPRFLVGHYTGLALKHCRSGELKKVLLAAVSVLSAKYVEEHQEIPPFYVPDLVNATKGSCPPEVVCQIETLITAKREGASDLPVAGEGLLQWIQSEATRLSEALGSLPHRPGIPEETLNRIVLEAMEEVWQISLSVKAQASSWTPPACAGGSKRAVHDQPERWRVRAAQ